MNAIQISVCLFSVLILIFSGIIYYYVNLKYLMLLDSMSQFKQELQEWQEDRWHSADQRLNNWLENQRELSSENIKWIRNFQTRHAEQIDGYLKGFNEILKEKL